MKQETWNQEWDTGWMPDDDLSNLAEPEEKYSLEEILAEFSGDRYAAPDETVLPAWEGEERPVPDTEAVQKLPEVNKEPEVNKDWQPAMQPQPQPEPASEHGADPEAETEKKPPERTRRVQVRRRQKVVEEFPETPEETSAPVTDGVDYSALFRMFADEAPAAPSTGKDADKEMPRDEGQSQAAAAGTSGSSGSRSSEPANGRKTAEEPLFAADPLDFRDILREFMLGDQHPIYAEMPGIGKKADGEKAEDTGISDLDAVLNEIIRKQPEDPQPEVQNPETQQPPVQNSVPQNGTQAEGEGTPRREQKPEPEQQGRRPFSTGLKRPDLRSILRRKKQEEESRDSAGDAVESEPEPESSDARIDTDPVMETAAEARTEQKAASSAADGSDEEVDTEGSLMKFLRGMGPLAGQNRKRALNAPKAFARYDDYIQPEADADTPETASADRQPGRTAGHEDHIENPFEKEADSTGDGESAADEDDLDEAILYSGDFPSFGQWILNELMTIWIRLNGIGDRQSTATMEDDSEDLGREVNVANASRYYGSQVTMLRMRFQIGLVPLAILAYITLGLPVSGMLKTAKVAAAMCLGLQLTIMLLCLDVVTNAAVNLLRRKFGADSLAVLACLVSSFDALSVAAGGFGNPHIPLCLFSSISLMGVLLSSLLSARALRKSTRVPAIGKRVYTVTAEEGVRSSGDLTLLKSVRPSAGFVRRAEETPPDEGLFARTALLQLLAAVVLSLLTAIVKHSIGDLLYILSAILSCAVPFTALLAFALPFFIGSERIFSSGAAVAGWSGIHDIGCSRNLIVTDRDLFPEDTISIETVRIFADDSAERVIGFAGTMVAASGSGLAPCFADLMQKNGCRMRQVEDFQWLAGGGLQGRIEGSTVLCGSSDLMQLMNVRVPYRLVDKTTVLLAIDGVLYGIFKISYTGLPAIRTALQELIASNRHPIFAIRDFLVTPEMLHEVFDVATDGYDFPPYGDRFRISEAQPSETSKISAVICREGLGPLTHLTDTGRSMYVAIRLNLLITAAVAALGMLLVFFRLIGAGEVSAWLPFVLNLLGTIIVTLVSLFMRF